MYEVILPESSLDTTEDTEDLAPPRKPWKPLRISPMIRLVGGGGGRQRHHVAQWTKRRRVWSGTLSVRCESSTIFSAPAGPSTGLADVKQDNYNISWKYKISQRMRTSNCFDSSTDRSGSPFPSTKSVRQAVGASLLPQVYLAIWQQADPGHELAGREHSMTLGSSRLFPLLR